MKETIFKMFDGTLTDISLKKFVLASFSTHCRTREGVVIPAEGAMLEMSIFGGISKQGFHGFIEPGKIPLGYRADCISKARKTHNLPLESEELYRLTDAEICKTIVEMIYRGSVDGKPQPGNLLC
jgi:protein maelstrom